VFDEGTENSSVLSQYVKDFIVDCHASTVSQSRVGVDIQTGECIEVIAFSPRGFRSDIQCSPVNVNSNGFVTEGQGLLSSSAGRENFHGFAFFQRQLKHVLFSDLPQFHVENRRKQRFGGSLVAGH